MMALVFTAPGVVEVQGVPEPEAGEGEVVVTVDSVGICGSELHGISSGTFRKPPLIMGHEFSGRLPNGTPVVVNPLLSCGSCDMCRRAAEHLCRSRQIIGIHRPGAFAERVAVPASAVHVLDAAMSLEHAAVIEPLANGVHVIRIGQPGPGARIGIIGSGTIGLTALLAAREHTDDVVVCDVAEDRLAVAAQLGAVRTTTELEGEFDLIIDAVGSVDTHRESIARLRPGGTAVWIGLLHPDAGFDAQDLVRDEKRVLSSYCYTRQDFAEAQRLAAQVRLDWTTAVPLSDGEAIFAELMAGRRDLSKVLLRP